MPPPSAGLGAAPAPHHLEVPPLAKTHFPLRAGVVCSVCLSVLTCLPECTPKLYLYIPLSSSQHRPGPHSLALGSIPRSAVCQDSSFTNKAAVQLDLRPGWSFVLGLLGPVLPPVPAGAPDTQAQQRPLTLPEDLLAGESTPSPSPGSMSWPRGRSGSCRVTPVAGAGL